MRKTPTSIITKIFILVSLILTIIGISFFTRSLKSDNELGPITQVMPNLLSQLQARWEQGDLENFYSRKKFQCPKLIFNSELVDSEFFKCNPNYLECFLQGKTGIETDLIHQIDDKKYKVEFIKKGQQFVEVTANDSVQLQIKVSGLIEKPLMVELKNTCRDTYLPQRIYSAGAKGEDRYLWDNFSRHIYVDRFYVSNQDVYFWNKTHPGMGEIPVITDPRYWFFPSTNLTLRQRKHFCKSYGKQLLQSHVLDAASFIPSNIDEPRNKFIYKHPYPWSKKSKSEFLSIAQEKRDYELTPSDCTKVNIKGCDKIVPYKFYSTNTASWVGMYFPLGDYLEVVENKFNSFQNLKASSFYFGAESKWHEIGKRAHWDGEGMDLSHFSFKESLEDKDIETPQGVNKLQVAFRCMKYREEL